MAILKRPMFRKGGSANSGIMDGLDRRNYANSNWEDIAASQMRPYPIYGNWGQQNTKPISFEDFQESFKGGTYAGRNRDVLIEQEVGSEGDVVGVPLHDFKIPKVKTDLEIALEKEAGSEQTLREIEKEKAWKTKKIPPLPEKKKKELEKIIAKNESLDDKTKRYMQMMAPHMQKRMVADALGAASAAFGESTGNTGQDIANAITAAAAGMGGTKDIYDKVKMLTLQGEIMKDVEAAKPKKLGNYEFLAKLSKEDPDTFNAVMKSGDTVAEMAIEFSKKYQTKGAAKGLGDAYQLKASSANAKNYGGTLDLTTDGKTADFEKMVKGQIYYNYLDLNFYAIGEDGTPTQVTKPDYLK